MAETSRFWDGTTLGDALVAPYDASVEFANVLRSIAGAGSFDVTGASGVFAHEPLVDSELITDVGGGASPIAVFEGRALVDGTWYENDAAVFVVIPTPGVSTRIDRIVLRKDFVAQTIRITRIAGAEGGTAPAITQIAGVTWDMYLSSVTITTAGVITSADEREFLNEGMHPMALATGTATGVWTGGVLPVALNTVVASYMITHDTVNGRFTALYPGMYLCGYSIPSGFGYVNGGSDYARGNVSFHIRKNGVEYLYGGKASIAVFSAGGTAGSSNMNNLSKGVSAVACVHMESGDYVEVWRDPTELFIPAGSPPLNSVAATFWMIRVSRMKVPR